MTGRSLLYRLRYLVDYGVWTSVGDPTETIEPSGTWLAGVNEVDDEQSLVQLDVLRVKRNFKKNCECQNRHLIVDMDNHVVECGECGAYLDPFEALVGLAADHKLLNEQSKALMKQQKELKSYKPWLKVIKNIERQYRGREMLPTCPHCHEPFYLEEINGWTNAEFYERSTETK